MARLAVWILAPASIFAGCGPGDPKPCSYASYGACNEQATARMQPFDEVHNCIAAEVTVVGLCMSSVVDLANPHCGHSASLGRDCAISPDGSVYVRYEDGDEYVSGAGWRSMHYPIYSSSTRPRSADLTADDVPRCIAALCAPACVGGNPIAVHGALCADAGSGVATQDGAGED